MHSPWAAVDLATDPVVLARLLRRAHEVVLSGCGTPPVLRDVIVRSWQRCAEAGVDPDRPAPMMLNADEASVRFAAHPLATVVPLVRSLLGDASAQARHLVAIADADGLLLWSEGHPKMREAAAGPHFTPGALYSEAAAGTNAVGTALAVAHPVQVFSAEHYNRLLHGWTGAAAPVRDPATGAVLGAIGLSSSFRHAHPHTLALVGATARAAEAQLGDQRARRDAELIERYIDRLPGAGRRLSALVAADGRVLAASPRRWLGPRVDLDACQGPVVLADRTRALIEPMSGGARIIWGVRARERRVPRRELAIRALGVPAARVDLGGASLPLTMRQAEVLVVLAMSPGGLSARDLARQLHGPAAKVVTARSEVSRLRGVMRELVGAQPYRLAADVRADFLEVERLLSRHRIAAAVERYDGPLLPYSRAPAIVARRAALEAAMGAALEAAGDDALRRRWERKRRRTGCNPLQPLADSRRPAGPVGC